MQRFKAVSLLIHIAAWLLFLSFPLLFLSRGQSKNALEILVSWQYLQFCLVFISIFYLNAFLLIPKIYLSKKYLSYILSIILLLIIVICISPFKKLLFFNFKNQGFNQEFNKNFSKNQNQPNFKNIPPPYPLEKEFREPLNDTFSFNNKNHRPPKPFERGPIKTPLDIYSIFTFMVIIAISMAYRIVQQWHLSEKKVLLAEKEKTNAELSFLKAQVNPHFLFNTLNNIYSLSIMNSPHTSESILKLSNIMHFVTDEASANFIPLSKEIDFVKDYIDLQRLRLGEKTKVFFEVKGEIDQQIISPLIFIPFIENTFKYGISKKEASEIIIKIYVDDKQITFHSINHIFNGNIESHRTGIGIVNTKKRLLYLYPNKHKLSIRNENKVFIVDLKISF